MNTASVCVLMGALTGGVLGWVLVSSHQLSVKVGEFEARCEEQGGVTLMGRKYGQRWLGCYDVKELENE